MDDLYREQILDHYKSPETTGGSTRPTRAPRQNPLCGDEIGITVNFDGSDTIEAIRFDGRGCAISQAAASMLTELVSGRSAADVAAMPKEELLEEARHPAHARTAEVRAARVRRPQGGAAPGQGNAAAAGVGGRGRARDPLDD